MNHDDIIVVTGAYGLVGSSIVENLKRRGYRNVLMVGRKECDLSDPTATTVYFKTIRPRYVFHTAARVYGIMGNMMNKAQSFYDNIMINTNVIDASRKSGVEKITAMGTGAIYPFPSPGLPLKESMIFMGSPHPAEDSYANAKRAMLAMLKAYEESYKLKWAYLISCNLFGPRDKFDIEYGHVVPALIKKFFDAKGHGTNVTVWGNGSAQRDFMYVSDAASAAIEVMEKLEGAVNLGSGKVYSIAEIVEIIADISDMHGRIDWDKSKPNGQDYRAYELSRLDGTGFKCRYTMKAGLKETWDWFSANPS